MTTYVALLRGINLGRNRKVAMADLRRLVEGLGHTGVRTHLQSGNVVFSAGGRRRPATLAAELEKAIDAELGLAVPVLVRTAAELRAAFEENPVAVHQPTRVLFTFLSAQPAADRLAALDPAEFAPEEFAVGDRVIYVAYPDGLQGARLSHAVIEKRLGVVATGRNYNTVKRLVELAADGPG